MGAMRYSRGEAYVEGNAASFTLRPARCRTDAVPQSHSASQGSSADTSVWQTVSVLVLHEVQRIKFTVINRGKFSAAAKRMLAAVAGILDNTPKPPWGGSRGKNPKLRQNAGEAICVIAGLGWSGHTRQQ